MAWAPKLDLVPACYDLMDFEHYQQAEGQDPFYVTFWHHILGILDIYDYILIDCPPNLYRTTQCAIFAAHEILVPCNPDNLSIIGLAMLAEKITEIQTQFLMHHNNYRQYQQIAKIEGIIINNKHPNYTVSNIRSDREFQSLINGLRDKGYISASSDILMGAPKMLCAKSFET